MPTVTKSRPRVKPDRTVRLELAPATSGPGVVTIGVGRESSRYYLTRLAGDFGQAFHFTKIGTADEYDVNLDGDYGTCECLGFLRHGYCKHVAALTALRNTGKLEGGAA